MSLRAPKRLQKCAGSRKQKPSLVCLRHAKRHSSVECAQAQEYAVCYMMRAKLQVAQTCWEREAEGRQSDKALGLPWLYWPLAGIAGQYILRGTKSNLFLPHTWQMELVASVMPWNAWRNGAWKLKSKRLRRSVSTDPNIQPPGAKVIGKLMVGHDLCPKGLVPQSMHHALYKWIVWMRLKFINTLCKHKRRLLHEDLLYRFNETPAVCVMQTFGFGPALAWWRHGAHQV